MVPALRTILQYGGNRHSLRYDRQCIWKGTHMEGKLRYYIVWILKYQKRVLNRTLVNRLHEFLYQVVEINGWCIEEHSIVKDLIIC